MFDVALAQFTDAINPSLAVLSLVAPWIARTRCAAVFGRRFLLWLPVILSVIVVYSVKYADDSLVLWPRIGLDYSTHTAFAIAIIVPLAILGRVWAVGLGMVFLNYAVLMMYFNYHTLTDIVTTAGVIAAPAWGSTRLSQRIGASHSRERQP
jgi:hypothetical protein